MDTLFTEPVPAISYPIFYSNCKCPRVILFLFLFLGPFYSYCQQTRISGQLRDTITGKNCGQAAVSLFKGDSVRLAFTQSGRDGQFSFYTHLSGGDYYLQVSHPSYDLFYLPIHIHDTLSLDLGILVLHPKADSLAAVVIMSPVLRPRIKGDTLEYNTGNIRMRVNANVEEMLSRLPGLRVESNGVITYNGERIRQLLVDGEDLFGSDPTIVTRNFDASRIAKVQLLDRKSDRTIFSGIDDGQRLKTLNLVLKESSRNGLFGKGEVGGNTGGNYNINGLLAAFRGREQFAALGMASNTGVLGFSNNTGGSEAGLSVLDWNNDPLGASAGYGIPRFVASGLHYANTWNGHEDHIVGNYQFGHIFTRPFTTLHIIQTLPDTSYIQDQQSASVNNQDQHSLNLIYDLVPDSLSAWKFSLNGANTEGQSQYSSSSSSAFNETKVNSSDRSIRSNASHSNWNGILSWQMHARHHAARSLSLTSGLTRLDDQTDGYLYSLNRYYQAGGNLQNMDTVDQRKQLKNQASTVNGSLNYTEPLWRNTLLGISYGISYTGSRSLQATYNRGDGKYEDYVDSLSSHYRNHTVSHQAGVTIQGGKGGFSYTAGTDMLDYSYRQQDLLKNSVLHYHYLNIMPRAFINWLSDPVTNFSLLYGGRVQQPSIAQLQAVRNNNDPLHITLGNPALRPGFNQNFNLGFRRMKAWMINLDITADITSTGISNRTYTDSLGRQITQPVNVNGGKSAGFNASFTKRVLGIDLTLRSNSNYARSFNFVNADLSRNDNYTIGGGFSLVRNVPDKYMFQFHTGITHFQSHISVDIKEPIHYWSQVHTAYLVLYFLKGFDVGTDAIYNWQQKTSGFTGSNWTLAWNASVSRNLVNNLLVLRLQVNNLLDQKTGIGRSNTGNTNTQTFTNVLGRYWMISATYRFDKKVKNR